MASLAVKSRPAFNALLLMFLDRTGWIKNNVEYIYWRLFFIQPVKIRIPIPEL